jgi:outer membrane protein OmpA-like peptidoglycan-associated protein
MMNTSFKKYYVFFILLCANLQPCLSQSNNDTTLSFYFTNNCYSLDTLQQIQLKNWVTTANKIVSISAFTDSVGSTSNNFTLATNRANFIKNVCQIEKVDYTYLVEIVGENCPQKNELFLNRRVDIVINRSQPLPKIIIDTSTIFVDTISTNTIYFYPDTDIFTQDSYNYLQVFAKRLQKISLQKLQIFGHVIPNM